MKTLAQHNDDRWENHKELQKMNEPHPIGIECPKCQKELWDSDPMSVLASFPPKKDVHCPACGYHGYRMA